MGRSRAVASASRRLGASALCAWLAIGSASVARAEAGPPQVVATQPPRGAIGVEPSLASVTITFSEPMHPVHASYTASGPWAQNSFSWSPDGRTATITRTHAATPLPSRDLIEIVLNPPGSVNYFRDLDGNPLPSYRLAFGVEPYYHAPSVVATVPANGATGVDPNRATFTVTFSEPMAAFVNLNVTRNWSSTGSTTSWFADRRTVVVTRNDAGAPLAAGARIEVTLNDQPGHYDALQPPAHFRNDNGDLLEAYAFAFTVGGATDGPRVVATAPADGERRADPHLAEAVVTFDRAMIEFACVNLSTTGDDWSDPEGPVLDHWSPDFRSYHIVRNHPETVLRHGKVVVITLNPQPCGELGFRDQAGNRLLGVHSFAFTIGGDFQLYEVPADPEQGFDWPYFLGLPAAPGATPPLMVEPDNTGAESNDAAVHERAAEFLADERANHFGEIGVPWLVPAFPRPVGLYTHVLDRETLLTSAPGLARVDLQLRDMIGDARRRLAQRGLTVQTRVLLHGFSASGGFANRFALLHPERVKAAAYGSGAGWPTVPVAAWEGDALRYPVGISDLVSLTGRAFALDAFRRVPVHVYVGDEDEDDPVAGWDAADRDLVYALTGVTTGPIWPRWPVAEAIYDSAGAESHFAVYPGVDHTIASAMWADLGDFFAANVPEPSTDASAAAALAGLAGLAAFRAASRRARGRPG